MSLQTLFSGIFGAGGGELYTDLSSLSIPGNIGEVVHGMFNGIPVSRCGRVESATEDGSPSGGAPEASIILPGFLC